MLRQLHAILAPIRTRQRIDRGLRWMVAGALVGGVAGSALLVVRWLGTDVESTVALAVMAYSALAGFVAGLLWPASWHSPARLADAAFDLKDRTLTELDFAGRTE